MFWDPSHSSNIQEVYEEHWQCILPLWDFFHLLLCLMYSTVSLHTNKSGSWQSKYWMDFQQHRLHIKSKNFISKYFKALTCIKYFHLWVIFLKVWRVVECNSLGHFPEKGRKLDFWNHIISIFLRGQEQGEELFAMPWNPLEGSRGLRRLLEL